MMLIVICCRQPAHTDMATSEGHVTLPPPQMRVPPLLRGRGEVAFTLLLRVTYIHVAATMLLLL